MRKCPYCGSNDVIPILYGDPTFEAIEMYERGEVELGGGCIGLNSSTIFCRICKNSFSEHRSARELIAIRLQFINSLRKGHLYKIDKGDDKWTLKVVDNNKLLATGQCSLEKMNELLGVDTIFDFLSCCRICRMPADSADEHWRVTVIAKT